MAQITMELVVLDSSGAEIGRAPWKARDGAAAVYLTNLLSPEDPGAGLMQTGQGGGERRVLTANSANQQFGAGAPGDWLDEILLSVTEEADLTVIDGTDTVFFFHFSGAVTLPVTIPIRLYAQTGPWKISTGPGMTGLAKGRVTG